MEARFRVVFTGRVRTDLDPAQVKQEAATRLRASPAQLDQLFSLPRVILKKNVDAEYGYAYMQALQEIGMLVELEPMPADHSAAPVEAPSLSPDTPPLSDTSGTPPFVTPAAEAPASPATSVAPAVDERVIIPDDPPPVSQTTTAQEAAADDLAKSLAPLTEAYPTPAGASSISSSYERMQANLARAEALLNASPKPALGDIPTAEADKTPVRPTEQAMTEQSLTQAKSFSVSIGATISAAQEAQPSQIAKAPLLFRTTIECTACGTPHIIEGRLLVSVVPSGEPPATQI